MNYGNGLLKPKRVFWAVALVAFLTGSTAARAGDDVGLSMELSRIPGMQSQRVEFSLALGTTVRIETTDGYGGCNVDTTLTLYRQSDLQQVKFDDDGGSGYCSYLEAYLEPGDYSVAVKGYADQELGPFQLRLEQDRLENPELAAAPYQEANFPILSIGESELGTGEQWSIPVIDQRDSIRQSLHEYVLGQTLPQPGANAANTPTAAQLVQLQQLEAELKSAIAKVSILATPEALSKATNQVMSKYKNLLLDVYGTKPPVKWEAPLPDAVDKVCCQRSLAQFAFVPAEKCRNAVPDRQCQAAGVPSNICCCTPMPTAGSLGHWTPKGDCGFAVCSFSGSPYFGQELCILPNLNLLPIEVQQTPEIYAPLPKEETPPSTGPKPNYEKETGITWYRYPPPATGSQNYQSNEGWGYYFANGHFDIKAFAFWMSVHQEKQARAHLTHRVGAKTCEFSESLTHLDGDFSERLTHRFS